MSNNGVNLSPNLSFGSQSEVRMPKSLCLSDQRSPMFALTEFQDKGDFTSSSTQVFHSLSPKFIECIGLRDLGSSSLEHVSSDAGHWP